MNLPSLFRKKKASSQAPSPPPWRPEQGGFLCPVVHLNAQSPRSLALVMGDAFALVRRDF